MAEWVALRLPREVGEVLALTDVRRIVGLEQEYFRSRSAMGNGHAPVEPGPGVVAGAETVDWVMTRAETEGRSYSAAQVHAVLAAHVAYLSSVGLTRR
ncbi:MAG: hypothetical protein ACRD0J_18480 [Acidimicrobiales bacterium]